MYLNVKVLSWGKFFNIINIYNNTFFMDNLKNFIKQLDTGIIYTGIQVSLSVTLTRLQQVCDPWRFFNVYNLLDILRNIALHEQSMFSESKHNQIRERSVNYPGVGPSTEVSTSENQVIINRNTSAVVQDTIRNRDRRIIVFTPLIWIPGFVYAFSSEYRTKFTLRVLNQMQVPQFFSELFKRTRFCTTPVYRIMTGLYTGTWTILVGSYPQLANTFYDPSFLCSDNGLQAYIGFLAYLQSSEGNYIPMVDATKETLPVLESGNFVTFTGYSTTQQVDFLTATVWVIENSMNYISKVFAVDCTLGCVFYQDNSGSTPYPEYTSHHYAATTVDVGMTVVMACHYMVARVTGVQTNPRGKSNYVESHDTSTSVPESLDSNLPPKVKSYPKSRSKRQSRSDNFGISPSDLKFINNFIRLLKASLSRDKPVFTPVTV